MAAPPDRAEEEGAAAEEAAIDSAAERVTERAHGDSSELRPHDSGIFRPTAEIDLDDQPADQTDEIAPRAGDGPEKVQQHGEDGDEAVQE
jgi:hypothetical protein